MTSVLFTNIGELVTSNSNDDGRGMLGIHRDAALVVDDGRVAWIGPSARAPGADAAGSTSLGGTVLPGFVDSHAHLVFAGDRPGVRRADGRAARTPPAASAPRSQRPARRPTQVLRDNVDRLSTRRCARALRPSRCKSGLRPHRRGRVSQPADRAWLTTERPFSVPTSSRPSTPTTRRHTSTWSPARCSTPAPRTRASIDVFCDSGAFDGDQARADPHGGHRARAPRQESTPTSSVTGPGVQLAVELQRRFRRPLHAPRPTTTSTRCANSSTVATLLPGAEFSTRSPYPDARRLLDAGATVALAPTATRARATRPASRLHRHRRPRDAYDPRRGGPRGHARGCAGAGAPGHRAPRPGARADRGARRAVYIHLAYRPGVPLVRQVWRDGVRQI